MARRKKSHRRKVYSVTFGFSDGAVTACAPERKPSPKRMKEDGIHICPDGVFREYKYSPTDWHSWEDEQRVRAVMVLANRLNTRRAIRELVLPELTAIQTAIADVRERLERIERSRMASESTG